MFDFSWEKENAENLEKSTFSAEFLASLRGFEPPTYRLGGGRSILLSYGNIIFSYDPIILYYLKENVKTPVLFFLAYSEDR